MSAAEHNLFLDWHDILKLSLFILAFAFLAQQLNIDDLQPVFPTKFAHSILWDLEILLGLHLLTHFAAQISCHFLLLLLLASLAK